MTSAENSGFKPLIISFLCNWCSYAGADFAGVSRYQYPPSLRIIKVMCSGRVDPFLIFEAFRQGADGVLVAGCHPGDCHYIGGNIEAKHKMKYVARVIKRSRIPPQRFRLEWISASEGRRFAETVAEFTQELEKLGPISDESVDGVQTMDKMAAAEEEFLDSTVRWTIGKERALLEEGNVYGEKLDLERLTRTINSVVDTKYLKTLVQRVIKEAPLSVPELSEKLSVEHGELFDCLMQLKSEGAVNIVGFKDDYPVFQAME